jgi:hypothetical protein
MMEEFGGMIGKEIPKYSEKTCPSAAFFSITGTHCYIFILLLDSRFSAVTIKSTVFWDVE